MMWLNENKIAFDAYCSFLSLFFFFCHFYSSLTVSSVRMHFSKGAEVSLLNILEILHFSDSHQRFYPPSQKQSYPRILKKKKERKVDL